MVSVGVEGRFEGVNPPFKDAEIFDFFSVFRELNGVSRNVFKNLFFEK